MPKRKMQLTGKCMLHLTMSGTGSVRPQCPLHYIMCFFLGCMDRNWMHYSVPQFLHLYNDQSRYYPQTKQVWRMKDYYEGRECFH